MPCPHKFKNFNRIQNGIDICDESDKYLRGDHSTIWTCTHDINLTPTNG